MCRMKARPKGRGFVFSPAKSSKAAPPGFAIEWSNPHRILEMNYYGPTEATIEGL